MTETEPRSRSSWRPRFSLLTALLVTALVACGITIWQLWSEVGPLRAENRRLRAETGELEIDDLTKAYVINIPIMDENHWRWRVYLPPGGMYSFRRFSGHLPDPTKLQGRAWFKEVRDNGVGSSSTGSGLQGEFVLDCRLTKEDGKWIMVDKYTHHEGGISMDGGGKTAIYQPSGDWLSETQISSGAAAVRNQNKHNPGEPILLLHLQRPVVTKTPNGNTTSQSPTGSADGVVLWIEQSSPANQ